MIKNKLMNSFGARLGILIMIGLFLGCNQEIKEEATTTEKQFDEPFRPQFHFSPAANWMNDPNGMVYLEGEYHLFYQYYPDSTVWGPMHWGHAVSEDLVHWEHLPVAIEPDELGWIFSGSAVYDENNSSGLGTADKSPLVAIYTYHDPVGREEGRKDYQTQGIAYSIDNGRSWTKYEGNPVLENPGIPDFRDPKVSYVGDKWIMTLAVKDKISFYSSPDLINWEHESDFNPDWAAYGGVWECPDLFPLTTPGGEEKWILLVSINPGGPNGGSATQYFVGDFDGSEFSTSDDEVKWLDYGADNYAGVTWSNVPEADGRKLFIGWMSNWKYANIVPTENWRSANTLPRSLELIERGEEFFVASRPVRETKILQKETIQTEGTEITLTNELIEWVLTPEREDFSMVFSNSEGELVAFEKNGEVLTFDRSKSGLTDFHEAFGNLHQAPLTGLEVDQVRVFLDRSSIEIFINDGELVMTEILFPSSPYTKATLSGFENSNTLHYLESIW
jgi:fructan beta-fructosidase